MQGIQLFAIAVALAMDAFAVAIAAGVRLKRVTYRQMFRLAWHFGLFQAMMPIIGWYAGRSIHQYISWCDHWIAFGLLTCVGVNMIRESFQVPAEDQQKSDPTKGFLLVLLSIATSIDALAVGVSIAMLKVSILWPAFIIGIVALCFTVTGLQIGKKVGELQGLHKYAEIIGGMVLLGIGLKILWEA